MSNLKFLYGSFHSSLVASSFSSTYLFSSRRRLLSFMWDVGKGNPSEIPSKSGLRTRFSFLNLRKKKRKSCRDFCEFIQEVKSSNLTTVYLFAFAFSSLFDLWVLQALPILIYHLFVVNTLRAFKSRLVKRISVFRLIVFFHCDITKGTTARAVISQSDGSARTGLFTFWLVPLACEKEMIASLAKEDLMRQVLFYIYYYKTARQLKEGNSIAAVESLPNPNLKEGKGKDCFIRDNWNDAFV